MFSGSGRYFFVAGFFTDVAAVGLPRGIGFALAKLRSLAISLLRLAGAVFIAPTLRQAGWQGRARISRLLGIHLQPAEVGL